MFLYVVELIYILIKKIFVLSSVLLMVFVNCSKKTMKIVYVFDIHEALTKQINRYIADNIKPII